MDERIYALLNKIKNLDTEKLSMIEEAADNCLAVQALENITKRNSEKNIYELSSN